MSYTLFKSYEPSIKWKVRPDIAHEQKGEQCYYGRMWGGTHSWELQLQLRLKCLENASMLSFLPQTIKTMTERKQNRPWLWLRITQYVYAVLKWKSINDKMVVIICTEKYLEAIKCL